MQLRRDMLIVLKPEGADSYRVERVNGDLLFDSNEEYFIYFKEVRFVNGVIKGRYLGEATENIIDDYCRYVEYDDGSFYVGNKEVKTALMVAVDNKTKTVIILEDA